MIASSRLLLALLFALIAPLAPAAAQPTFQVGRGMSMDQWVTWPASATWHERQVYQRFPEWMEFVSDSELAQLQRAGIDTIRLPVEPAFLMHNDDPERLGIIMAGIKIAIDRLAARGFKVIVDMHTIGRGETGVAGIDEILNDPSTTDQYLELLAFVTGQLRHYASDQLALEVINEPSLDCANRDRQRRWQTMAENLHRVARNEDSSRTIIMSGACWGSADGLAAMQTAAMDDNVIWTFHSYEPFAITHQGAKWTGDLTAHLRDIPYPPFRSADQSVDAIIERNARNIRQSASGASSRHAVSMLKGNLNDSATAAKLDRLLRRPFETAARWADENGIARSAIFLGEFGMIGREYGTDLDVPAEWRVAYMRDMIMLAEEYGFGWSVWSFGGAFGLMQAYGGEQLEQPLVTDLLPETLN